MPREKTINPQSPRTYKWSDLSDDYTALWPELKLTDLRAITGYSTLTATNGIFFGFQAAPKGGLPETWMSQSPDPKAIRLDNQLHWFFSPKELCAVLRYRHGGRQRDLLFIRPEAYEAVLSLLPVSAEARRLGIKSHSEQIIGYFTVPRSDSARGRIVLVVDTALSNHLPVDEEELLSIKDLR